MLHSDTVCTVRFQMCSAHLEDRLRTTGSPECLQMTNKDRVQEIKINLTATLNVQHQQRGKQGTSRGRLPSANGREQPQQTRVTRKMDLNCLPTLSHNSRGNGGRCAQGHEQHRHLNTPPQNGCREMKSFCPSKHVNIFLQFLVSSSSKTGSSTTAETL